MDVRTELHYCKIRPIGVGQGMNSEVFEIEDSQLGGRLAVKEIPIANFQNSVEDYFAEAKAMFASRHRNIVPIQYASKRDNTHVCLVMPYFTNGSLQSHILFNPLSLKQVINLGQEILSGVSQIHTKGYLHLDIKPSNILFSDVGVPMVADFGQARTLGDDGVVTKLPPMYNYAIPPEILTQRAASIESDIYQVGLTLYRAVNGDYIYQNQLFPIQSRQDLEELQLRVLSGTLPNRSLFLPHVPMKLRTALRKALNPDVGKRFPSAIEFQEALGRISLTCDWKTQLNPDTGEIQWRARRENKADLLVNLCIGRNSADWRIEIFTERECTDPRKSNTNLWANKLSFQDANQHLETVFQNLG